MALQIMCRMKRGRRGVLEDVAICEQQATTMCKRRSAVLHSSTVAMYTGSVVVCENSVKFFREFRSDAQLASIFG